MVRDTHSNAGFTLIELLVVVAILAILSAIAIPQYLKYTAKAKKANVLTTTKELSRAVQNLAASAYTNADCTTAASVTVTYDDTNHQLVAKAGDTECDTLAFEPPSGVTIDLGNGITASADGNLTGTITVTGLGYQCTCDLPQCNPTCSTSSGGDNG